MARQLREEFIDTTYDEANQIETFTPQLSSITHDDNGNMKTVINSCGITTYTWDVRNRLVGINDTCASLLASFKYDALGRRIEKTVNGTTIQYLYDGMDIVQEIEDGQVTVNYIRTLNIDEPLARIEADGTLRYYHADALGSIIALSDENGVVKTTYTYDPFGNTFVSGEASDNPFQYTGRENDGTGLYYYRARYYSPELQRFISEDPIGLLGGVNFYTYVGNNPVNYIDPLGLWKFSWGIGGALGMFDINWNSLEPYNTNLDIVSPQLGGGLNFCFIFDKPSEKNGCDSNKGGPFDDEPLPISVGYGRYLGIGSTTAFDRICINAGFSTSTLPFNFGLPVYSYSHE